MRKVYPSSGRQVREGRFPSRLALTLERDGATEPCWSRRTSQRAVMTGFLPPLSETITSLLYFADYERQEYEPVLDERMIVYTYVAFDPAGLPAGLPPLRGLPDPAQPFPVRGPRGRRTTATIRTSRAREMERQIYRRWAHQGTYYGFTSYSNVTAAIGTFDCDEHQLREGFLIHRMFNTRYYLMALVALFYRATLLDFSERTALVSKQLYLDQDDDRFAAREHPAGQRPARRLPALLQLLALRGAGQQGRGDRALRHAVPRVPHRPP